MLLAADPTSVGFFIVFVAGIASFLSPCVLPLVPAYLSYMSGVSIERVHEGEARVAQTIVPTVLFVLGFSTVFVALGLSATYFGSFLRANQRITSIVSGLLIIVMGLAFIGVIPIPWLYSERRFEVKPGSGSIRNYLMGMAFGFGWTPCIGPVLGATLTIAANESTPGRGALLLSVYSLGLGIPFILSALGVSRLVGALAWFRRHQRTIVISSGTLMIAFGFLILFNKVYWLSSIIRKAMEAVGLTKLVGL